MANCIKNSKSGECMSVLKLRPQYGELYNSNSQQITDDGIFGENYLEKYYQPNYTGNLTDDEKFDDNYVQRQCFDSTLYFEKVKKGEIDLNDYASSYYNPDEPDEEIRSENEIEIRPPDYDDFDDLDNTYASESDDDFDELFSDDEMEYYGEEECDDDDYPTYYKPSRQWGYC